MLLPLLVSLALAADKPTVAVFDLQAAGVPAASASAIQDAVTDALAKRGFFEVISASEIRSMLGVERQKQLMGCSEGTSCTAELADALGSRFVLTGTLSKLGDAFQLSLQLLDTQKGQPIGRGTRIAQNERALVAMLPWLLAEATSTPAPPAPSKVLPIAIIGLGAVALAAGGILGVNGLSRDSALQQDLAQPDTGAFKPRAFYNDEAQAIGVVKTASLISLISGAALVTLGALLFPPEVQASVAMVPTARGFALVGVWR